MTPPTLMTPFVVEEKQRTTPSKRVIKKKVWVKKRSSRNSKKNNDDDYFDKTNISFAESLLSNNGSFSATTKGVMSVGGVIAGLQLSAIGASSYTSAAALIKKLRREKKIRTKRESRRLLTEEEMQQKLQRQKQQENVAVQISSDGTAATTTITKDQQELGLLDDLDAEEEMITVQARVEQRAIQSNIQVCLHQEAQNRMHMIEDEEFIRLHSLMAGFYRGREQANFEALLRTTLCEIREQREEMYQNEFLHELDNVIGAEFRKEKDLIRQHDLYVLFESLDEKLQRHLMDLSKEEREQFLDDLAVERFLKSKVSGLKRGKRKVQQEHVVFV